MKTSEPRPGGGAPGPGPGYAALRDAVGQVDYLVLLGDIIDLSVAGCEDAYRDAKVFFTALQRDGLARELVYVPGNHDFDIWNVVEHQVSVINQLKQGELPRPFKRAVPGVIDARDPEPRLRLPDVSAHPEWRSARSSTSRRDAPIASHATWNGSRRSSRADPSRSSRASSGASSRVAPAP